MSRIMTILRAAHCRSTHHYFALDALRHVNTERGGRLSDLLLRHYDQYLKGAKDPDSKFRDFQNHVLHVNDNCWGGAPRCCEKWLKTALNHLNSEQWEEAAYSLGVLSHYFTDPLMPLHTGSSDAEGIVHRPMEWSVCKSYDSIYQRWASGKVRVRFQLPQGNDWISQAVIAGAEVSHSHYHRIIEIYDLTRGVKRPPEGLNAESRDILAEMFGIAITGWARILERIAEQATCEMPAAGLSISTIVATIDLPVAWIIKKITSLQEKAAIKAIFNEFNSTGTVRVNLPPEVRTVRTEMAMSVNRNPRAETRPDVKPLATKTLATDRPAWQPTSHAAMESQQKENVSLAKTQASTVSIDSKVSIQPSASVNVERPAAVKDAQDALPATAELIAFRLPGVSPESLLVDAPSIGPKTAQRFEKIGIHTIGQFLAVDPATIAKKLETRWITADLVSDWQSQADLVCRIASLCGYKSQLLVALDVRSASQLAQQNASALGQRITDYCATKSGERILRSSAVPDQEEVATWIADAQSSSKRLAG